MAGGIFLRRGGTLIQMSLEGIDSSEIINTVHHRPAPVLPASAGLR